MCGDFNVNLDNNKKIGRRERNLMKNLIYKNNLVDSVDVLRKKNEKCFTFIGEGKEKSRIDYLLLSPNLLEATIRRQTFQEWIIRGNEKENRSTYRRTRSSKQIHA